MHLDSAAGGTGGSSLSDAAKSGCVGLRCGVLGARERQGVDAEQLRRYDAAIECLRELGVVIEAFDWPRRPRAWGHAYQHEDSLGGGLWVDVGEMASDADARWGSVECAQLANQIILREAHQEHHALIDTNLLDELTCIRLAQGAARHTSDSQYSLAHAARVEATRSFGAAMRQRRLCAILSPTTPTLPPTLRQLAEAEPVRFPSSLTEVAQQLLRSVVGRGRTVSSGVAAGAESPFRSFTRFTCVRCPRGVHSPLPPRLRYLLVLRPSTPSPDSSPPFQGTV